MSLKRELLYIDDLDRTDEVETYYYKGNKCIVVFKNNSNKEFLYSKSRAKIVRTAISEEEAFNVFNYLKEISHTVGLKTDDGDNILQRNFENIREISNDCVLSYFLNPSLNIPNTNLEKSIIFPFGFNLSQKIAVENAFTSSISIIEGPPGTGKTQTILNIIANAVMNEQSVAIVSSNNSATKNVYEKLEKYEVEFIAALLGNADNKKEFISSQKEIPDLLKFKLSSLQKSEIQAKLVDLKEEISQNLKYKNEYAQLDVYLENIKVEFQHFNIEHEQSSEENIIFRKNVVSKKFLELWFFLEGIKKKKRNINFLQKIIFRFKYGIKDKSFYNYSLDKMIIICQRNYYLRKIFEIQEKIEFLEKALQEFVLEEKLKEYSAMSMTFFKGILYDRYKKHKREHYSIPELKQNSNDFLKDYPVIMSTTYSLRQSLSERLLYDFVIIDESSQVDIATGALALSCAKRTVIVGDTKQLPNVVESDIKIKTDEIFSQYKLNSGYRYSNHSLLTSILELIPNAPKTLLREHYRCHPKIIEFCNKKFYDNQLIIHSDKKEERKPLVVYRTVQGNHARGRINQRQIDVIKQEIIPNENLNNVDLGIVTPYRDQTKELNKAFKDTSIKADTVDKFQGRENDVIILSTVDNELSDFTDNPNRLNVAVSRAKEQLIVVVNGNDNKKDGNIKDLIQYIDYNNFSIKQSELYSIFDLLYKDYEEERKKLILKMGKVSDYDSENLMYGLIKEILLDEKFSKYDVISHFPTKKLFKDLNKLNDQERKYVLNTSTHIDFLLYNKITNTPILAIEVDGFEFHKSGTRQAQRDEMKNLIFEKYNFPLIRFRTNDSNEMKFLIEVLNEIQQKSSISF